MSLTPLLSWLQGEESESLFVVEQGEVEILPLSANGSPYENGDAGRAEGASGSGEARPVAAADLSAGSLS